MDARSADLILALTASMSRLATSNERLLLPIQGVLNTASELNEKYVHELRADLTEIKKHSGAISKSVDELRGGVAELRERAAVTSKGVDDVRRDLTGPTRLAAPETTGRHPVIGAISAFGRLPTRSQVILGGMVVLVAAFAGGWLAKLVWP